MMSFFKVIMLIKMYMSVICESTIRTHHFTILIRMLSKIGYLVLHHHMYLQEKALHVVAMRSIVLKSLRI